MVQKLQLPTFLHPRPYKLHWMNECGEDNILCDVVPMQACHIFLGRPWQYDRKVIHDGFTNRHSFEFKGKTVVLKPMTPTQVADEYDPYHRLVLRVALGVVRRN